DLRMRNFSPAKEDRNLNALFLFQEAANMVYLKVNVMLARARAKFDFFDQNLRLVFTRLLNFFLLQVAEFAVIHYPAYRRSCCGRPLYQIELFAFRKTQCFT